jgi:hypothetical protein
MVRGFFVEKEGSKVARQPPFLITRRYKSRTAAMAQAALFFRGKHRSVATLDLAQGLRRLRLRGSARLRQIKPPDGPHGFNEWRECSRFFCR